MTDEWEVETEGTAGQLSVGPGDIFVSAAAGRGSPHRVQTLGGTRLWPGTISCGWHGPCARHSGCCRPPPRAVLWVDPRMQL